MNIADQKVKKIVFVSLVGIFSLFLFAFGGQGRRWIDPARHFISTENASADTPPPIVIGDDSVGECE